MSVHDPRSLLQLLNESAIAHEVIRHPPLMTVDDSKRLRGEIDATHVKNLLLRDKKRRTFLVTAHEDAHIELKTLRRQLAGSGSLSFASADRLRSLLGVEPGAVSPLGLLNADPADIEFHLDRTVGGTIAVHPLTNDATVVLATSDLIDLLAAHRHPTRLLDLSIDGHDPMAYRRNDS